MHLDPPNLPPFQVFATAAGLLTPAQMDGIIAAYEPRIGEAMLGQGGKDQKVRRSQVVFLHKDASTQPLYDRIWDAAQGFNERFFAFDIAGMFEAIQLARYDASDQGFYDWHTDFGDMRPNRKISITVQLSDPADYDGGELQFSYREFPHVADKTRGVVIAFPSFQLHRVTPVTRGRRWSLVAWISGRRFR